LAKATVCKTVIRRFESGSGLTFIYNLDSLDSFPQRPCPACREWHSARLRDRWSFALKLPSILTAKDLSGTHYRSWLARVCRAGDWVTYRSYRADTNGCDNSHHQGVLNDCGPPLRRE